jgi:hypothetical protein
VHGIISKDKKDLRIRIPLSLRGLLMKNIAVSEDLQGKFQQYSNQEWYFLKFSY